MLRGLEGVVDAGRIVQQEVIGHAEPHILRG